MAKLRARYAATFGLSIDEVTAEERDDEGTVWCPSRPDLPPWTTGVIQ